MPVNDTGQSGFSSLHVQNYIGTAVVFIDVVISVSVQYQLM